MPDFLLHKLFLHAGIALPQNDKLCVSKIVHKAFLEINEEGAEAAAATGAVIVLMCAKFGQPRVVADHPFLVLLMANDRPLFLGRIAQPHVI